MTDVQSLLPPNSTGLERAIEQAVRLDLPVDITALWSPALCPEPLLPWLAWGLSVDVWRDSWPVDVQRAVVAASLPSHARKGTRAAVTGALAALSVRAVITEWFQPGGTGVPHTFTVRALVRRRFGSEPVLSPERIDAIRAMLTSTAPLSRPWTLEIGVETGVDLVSAAAVPAAVKVQQRPMAPTPNRHAHAASSFAVAVVPPMRAIVAPLDLAPCRSADLTLAAAAAFTKPLRVIRTSLELAA